MGLDTHYDHKTVQGMTTCQVHIVGKNLFIVKYNIFVKQQEYKGVLTRYKVTLDMLLKN